MGDKCPPKACLFPPPPSDIFHICGDKILKYFSPNLAGKVSLHRRNFLRSVCLYKML